MRAFTCVFACALLATCKSASAEDMSSDLHIANLAQGRPGLTVEICPQPDGRCLRETVGKGSVLRLELKPAVYRFAISNGASVIERFRYGIGSGKGYSLALYGLADRPTHLSWAAWLKKWLGGSEERQVSGYQFHHRMFSLDSNRPDKPGRLRLINYAPGSAPVSGYVEWGTGGAKLTATRWDTAGKPVDLARSRAHLDLRLGQSLDAAARCTLDVPRGSLGLVYVTAIRGDKVEALVDAKKPARGRCM